MGFFARRKHSDGDAAAWEHIVIDSERAVLSNLAVKRLELLSGELRAIGFYVEELVVHGDAEARFDGSRIQRVKSAPLSD
jgi:hypothetical protein